MVAAAPGVQHGVGHRHQGDGSDGENEAALDGLALGGGDDGVLMGGVAYHDRVSVCGYATLCRNCASTYVVDLIDVVRRCPLSAPLSGRPRCPAALDKLASMTMCDAVAPTRVPYELVRPFDPKFDPHPAAR